MKKKSYQETYNSVLKSQFYNTYDEFIEIVKKNVKDLCDNRVFFSVVIVNDDSEMILYELIDAWTFSKSIEPWYLLCRLAVIHDVVHDDKIHEIVVEIM
nr:MAG TPA: hypothetical protein [Caudoviricetes sp.]